ncbi:MAG: hydrogenase iron-sulfur subunit [Gammaproteobacteria bacterium]|nr:hydrogenase iron-sulfur subunit [Gammaproteobacteria bacterium]
MNDEAATKTGAYLCQGCGLGDRLDVAQLAELAKSDGGAAVVRRHDMLCSAAGVAQINADIAEQNLTHLVIGACSRRAKTEAFNFAEVAPAVAPADGNGAAAAVAVARANLREGVIWTQPDTDEARETTQEMAADYVRMACAEARHMRPPAASAQRATNRRILVVGGGVSGMTAAVESAAAGYPVLLVEKTGQLGGWTRRLHRRLPAAEPYSAPRENDIGDLVARVEADRAITVFLNATVTRTSGAPGRFSVDITGADGVATENIGAIVQASGFSRYDAGRLPEFAVGKTPDVVDQMALEQLAADAGDAAIKRPSDGAEVTSVVFVQCAGQRSDKPGHLPYCSGFCCNVSIKQALYFKARNPAADTHIIYTDLRVPGNGEDFYRAAQEAGVAFTNGVVERVEVGDGGDGDGDGGGGLAVHFRDNILGEDAVAAADLVVLATGQVPNSGVDIAATGSPAATVDSAATNGGGSGDGDSGGGDSGSDGNSGDRDSAAATGNGGGQAVVPVESILNLDYRQGPDMPHLKHGFSDSHFICFPYETRRTGIYTCGPVRRPMDIQQAVEDATGAAMKAVQAIENAGAGRAAHPRAGDLSFPSFRREGCTQCKRCTVECPFGAIDEDETGYPQFNESRCRRCGTCMGACPVRVISFENYSVDTVGQQIKAIDMPDEFDEKPRILILACENDAYPALDMAAHNRIEYNAFVRVIPIRCLGSVNLIWVTDALNAGFDGIMLMGCKKGDDYQCHFVSGAALAHERMSKIDDTLEQLQLEPERVQGYEIEITDIRRVPQLINDYAAKIDAIGMNPFKGF